MKWHFLIGSAWLACSVVLAQPLDPQQHPDAAMLKRFRPPQVDRQVFEPLPAEQRQMATPRVKFLARKDGYEYCSRITGIPITPNSRPMACAFWNVRRSTCTIVTPELTGFNYVGHELRHCFEGAFHD